MLIESLLVLSTAEKVSRLSIEQLEVMTKGLDKLWKIEDQILTREFLFSSYEASIVFVNSVAQLAENQNHHPTILIDYCKVLIKITTHDAENNLTKKDFELAHSIDQKV